MKTLRFVAVCGLALGFTLLVDSCSQESILPSRSQNETNAIVDDFSQDISNNIKTNFSTLSLDEFVSAMNSFSSQFEEDFGAEVLSISGAYVGNISGKGELVHKLDPILVTPIVPARPKPGPDPEPEHDDAWWDNYVINHAGDLYEEGLAKINSLKNDPDISQEFLDTLNSLRPHEIVRFAIECKEIDMVLEVHDEAWVNDLCIDLAEEEGYEVYAEQWASYAEQLASLNTGGPLRVDLSPAGEFVLNAIECAVRAVGFGFVVDILKSDNGAANTFETLGVVAGMTYLVTKYGATAVEKMIIQGIKKAAQGPWAAVITAANFTSCMVGKYS